MQYGQISVSTGGVSIQLDTAQPYTEHAYVVQQYGGRPHGHGRHHDDDDDQGYGEDDRGHGHGHGRD